MKVSAAETSCGAAIRVKPRVRLCEPWVMSIICWEPRSGVREWKSA